MKITIKNIKDIPRDKQEMILGSIFRACDKGFLTWKLRELQIPGRTKVYQAFQFYYLFNQNVLNITDSEEKWKYQPQQGIAQIAAIKQVLDNSELENWVDAYLGTTVLDRVMVHLKKGIGNRIEIIIDLDSDQDSETTIIEEPKEEKQESLAQMLELVDRLDSKPSAQ